MYIQNTQRNPLHTPVHSLKKIDDSEKVKDVKSFKLYYDDNACANVSCHVLDNIIHIK